MDHTTLTLDDHLKKALAHLFQHWHDPKVSIVAAALVDGDKAVYATAYKTDTGERKHAERHALEKFKKLHGNPSPDAVMVITLGPCVTDSPTREGESCSSMLKKEGIHKVYVGAMDKTQQQSIAKYAHLGLETRVCKNRELARCCYMLEDMMERHRQDRDSGKAWSDIKDHIDGTPLCSKKFFGEKIARQSLPKVVAIN